MNRKHFYIKKTLNGKMLKIRRRPMSSHSIPRSNMFYLVCLVLFCFFLPSSAVQPDIQKINEALNYLASVGIQCGNSYSDASSAKIIFSHNSSLTENTISKKSAEKKVKSYRTSDHDFYRRLLQEESLDGGEEFHGGDLKFYLINGGMAALCVTIAALAAGLTMGMLSLDPLMLLIKIRASETKAERDQAALLLPLVQQHHRLLVSLLLMNACANEALPLFLDKLVPSYIAVILSVTLVLFFGEIIPSAVFTGPKQLAIAANLVPLVRFILLVLSPLAYPIAKILDHFLHDEDDSHGMNLYNRGELTALVRIQYEERMAMKKLRKKEMAKLNLDRSLPTYLSRGSSLSDGIDSLTRRSIRQGIEARLLEQQNTSRPEGGSSRVPLIRAPSWHHDEVTLVEGALSMKSKTAIDCYTPMRDVFAIPNDMTLNEANVVNIYSRGYSRVPVYDTSKSTFRGGTEKKLAICGILITKQLIVVNNNDNRVVSTMPLLQPLCIPPSTNLVDLINIFQASGTHIYKGGHLAFLCANADKANEALEKGKSIPLSAGIMGLITLEDVLEELLQEEILDELDKKELAAMRIAQWAFTKWKRFVKKKNNAEGSSELEEADKSQNSGGFYSIVEKVTTLVRAKSEHNNGSDIESGNNGAGDSPSSKNFSTSSAPLLVKDSKADTYGSSGL